MEVTPRMMLTNAHIRVFKSHLWDYLKKDIASSDAIKSSDGNEQNIAEIAQKHVDQLYSWRLWKNATQVRILKENNYSRTELVENVELGTLCLANVSSNDVWSPMHNGQQWVIKCLASEKVAHPCGDMNGILSPENLTPITPSNPSPAYLSEEIEILALISLGKQCDAAKWKHILTPQDIVVSPSGDKILIFDPLFPLDVRNHTLLQAANLGRQLLSGLQALHSLGIAHLDVSATNLLLDTEGQLILIDFGLARVCTENPHPPGRGTRGTVFRFNSNPFLSHDKINDAICKTIALHSNINLCQAMLLPNYICREHPQLHWWICIQLAL
jgi:serine/threonine protein kinase